MKKPGARPPFSLSFCRNPLREILQADGEGDNRLSIDPNG
jgi:hypothetical protein